MLNAVVVSDLLRWRPSLRGALAGSFVVVLATAPGSLRVCGAADAELTVVVVGPADARVQGARVEVRRQRTITSPQWNVPDQMPAAEPLAVAETGADGLASFREIGSGRLRVTVRARGMASAQTFVERAAGARELKLPIRLRGGTSLGGFVRDTTGRTLSGFRVSIAPAPPVDAGSTTTPESWTECGADGSYNIDGLAPGLHEVRTWTAENDVATSDVVRVGSVPTFDPEVHFGGMVFGRIRDAVTSEPLAGARVILADSDRPRAARAIGHATSGADGTFIVRTFRRLTQAQALVVEMPGKAVAEARLPKNSVFDGEPVACDFDLWPEARVQGVVSGPKGPLAGVGVVVAFAHTSALTPSPTELQFIGVSTSPDGRFSIGQIPEGAFAVFVVPHLESPGLCWTRPPIGLGATSGGLMSVPPAHRRGTARRGHSTSMNVTLSRSAAEMRRQAADRVAEAERRESSGRLPEFVVRGVVVSRHGAPLGVARVRVGTEHTAKIARPWTCWTECEEATVASDGTFAVGLAPKPGVETDLDSAGDGVVICIEAEGHAPALSRPFDRNDARARSQVVVEADVGATLHGRVVFDGTGAPLAGAAVVLSPVEERWFDDDVWPPRWGPCHDGFPRGRIEAVSGPDGRWQINHLEPGVYRVHPRAVGVGGESRVVELPSDQEIVLGVSRVGDIGGVVCDPEGRPVTGATVTLRVPGESPASTEWNYRTGPDGVFIFAKCPQRGFRVTVRPPGDRDLAAPPGADVAAGATGLRLVLPRR